MSTDQERDYPQTAAVRGRVEPAPRRVRGFLGEELIFDTTSARYVWEVPYYPQYYIPLADVRGEHLRDENHPQKVQFGASRLHSLVSTGHTHASAARVFDGDGDGPVAGLVRFAWDALTWFEEDEPIYGHPRNPYARVDALRSHRRVSVELEGVALAEPAAPSSSSKPACRQGITSTGPMSPSSIWPDRHPDSVSVQGRDVAVLVGAGRRRGAPRPGVDLSLSAAGRGADRGHGRVLQRETRHHRRRRQTGSSKTHFS